MVDLRGRSDRVGPHVRRDTLDMPGGVAVDSWPWIMELELSVRVDARYQQCGVLTLRARWAQKSDMCAAHDSEVTFAGDVDHLHLAIADCCVCSEVLAAGYESLSQAQHAAMVGSW